MSRLCIFFSTADISASARSLRDQFSHHDGLPGHLESLNMLARATSRRNFQCLRAQQTVRDRLAAPEATPASTDYVQVQRVQRHFEVEREPTPDGLALIRRLASREQ